VEAPSEETPREEARSCSSGEYISSCDSDSESSSKEAACREVSSKEDGAQGSVEGSAEAKPKEGQKDNTEKRGCDRKDHTEHTDADGQDNRKRGRDRTEKRGRDRKDERERGRTEERDCGRADEREHGRKEERDHGRKDEREQGSKDDGRGRGNGCSGSSAGRQVERAGQAQAVPHQRPKLAAPHQKKIPPVIWKEIGKEGRDLYVKESRREKQRAKRARRSEKNREALCKGETSSI